jgi:hypothetical protein
VFHDAKELYTAAEAHANATIKQQEDLNAQVAATAQREQAVAEPELKLREKEEQGNHRLERDLKALASHEATVAVERHDLEETRAMVLARELTADVRDSGLNYREKRLVEREQQFAGRQLQEQATTRSRLEELQAARAGEAQKVWDFLGQIEAALVPLGFCPLQVGDHVEEVTVTPRVTKTIIRIINK